MVKETIPKNYIKKTIPMKQYQRNNTKETIPKKQYQRNNTKETIPKKQYQRNKLSYTDDLESNTHLGIMHYAKTGFG